MAKDNISEDERLERIKRIDRILDSDFGDDLIGKLLDVENPLERTTSPSIGFVLIQLYLRQGASYFGSEVGEPLERLADNLSSAMISYKDRRMEHLREILKKAPENVTVSTSETKREEKEDKGKFLGFLRRNKEEF